jgi:sugar/nucleoside kinase (ribokinase family)
MPIEQVVDRCGATECLETWVAILLLQGLPLAEACERAVMAMAHTLSRRGGHQSMPRPSDIQEVGTSGCNQQRA